VTAPFLEGKQPVESATIARVGSGSSIRELGEEERNEVFTLAELLATAALAGRRFFDQGISYTNRDVYRLIVQSFDRSPEDVLTTYTRRRDGGAQHIGLSGPRHERKPNYVQPLPPWMVEWPLLDAIVRVRDRAPDIWDRTWDAIVSFNAANTDSDLVAKGNEVMLTYGAIQRLLDGSHKINEFAPVFVATTTPSQDQPIPSELSRKWPGCTTVREAWIRDLATVRNAFGHGKSAPDSNPYWNIDEHLLFGAYLFPLLLKRMLAACGVYTITRIDEMALDAFEARVLCRPFRIAKREDGNTDEDTEQSPWYATAQVVIRRELRNRMLRALELDQQRESSGEQA